MSKTLDKLHEKWKREGKPILKCGIGLNTGEVIVGNIGAEGKKMDYTIIGDHVNIGARVEKLTREFGARILISEHTLHYIKDQIALNKIGHVILTDLATVKVKGKEKKLRVYRFEDSEDDLI
jgi:adenylate cyclase